MVDIVQSWFLLRSRWYLDAHGLSGSVSIAHRSFRGFCPRPSHEDRKLSESKIKVIDRRMFTADGELREEYQDSIVPDVGAPASPAVTEPVSDAGQEASAPAETATEPASAEASPAAEEVAAPGPEADAEDDAAEGPRFTDLVAFMAQTAAAYLQQARATALGGQAGPASSSEMLQMARLHVDLLSVLERKTAGNLTAEELEMLRDVQRQLRLAMQ